MSQMDTALWNLLLKACSAAGGLLLLLSLILFGSFYLELSSSDLPAFISLFAGTVISFAAMAGLNLSAAHTRRQISAVTEELDDLAKGHLTKCEHPGELFDRIREVSAFLSNKAAAISLMADSGQGRHWSPPKDQDVIAAALESLKDHLAALGREQTNSEGIRVDLTELSRLADQLTAFDLTVAWEAGSSQAADAAVALNNGVAALRARVGAIRDTVVRLNAAASEFDEIAEQMLRSSNAQGTQIERSAGGIAGLARQMHGLEKRAGESLDRAGAVQADIASACKLAEESTGVMVNLRKQVQEGLRRTKRLGERSQELGQLTQAVEELSERLSILAMNSSLQDSIRNAPGPHAPEVEALADRAAKITRLMTSIHSRFVVESKEAAAAVEEAIRSVIHGNSLNERSASIAAGIESHSTELSELLEVLADSIRYQAKASHDSAAAMSGIAEVAELIRASAKRTSASSRQISQNAAELTAALSAFHLPPERLPRQTEASQDKTRFVN
jgi:methyl-accepting chemotaxis protein